MYSTAASGASTTGCPVSLRLLVAISHVSGGCLLAHRRDIFHPSAQGITLMRSPGSWESSPTGPNRFAPDEGGEGGEGKEMPHCPRPSIIFIRLRRWPTKKDRPGWERGVPRTVLLLSHDELLRLALSATWPPAERLPRRPSGQTGLLQRTQGLYH